MARFEIEQTEGTRAAKITLKDETIVAERGALAYMVGDIRMKSHLPGPIRLAQAALSGEDAFRPTFTGTGVLYLESSLGGFHILEVRKGESWIIESGAFWASEAKVTQTLVREKLMISLRSGKGLLDFQTKVSGEGKVMLTAPGPVEEIVLAPDDLNRGRIVADGYQVIARTSSVVYKAKLPGLLPWSRVASGERLLRSYEGKGRLLLCSTPYWRYRMQQLRQQDPTPVEEEATV
jgi:uncharacterized protein (AIM24 family)